MATFHARGTHDGVMAGMPPTGRSMDVPFCEVIHWSSDGRVLSSELYYDQVDLLTQLGVLGAPEAAPTSMSPAETVRSFFEAFDRQDFETLRAGLTDEPQGVDEISRRWLRGTEAIDGYFEGLMGSVSDLRSEVSDIDERVTGDTAVVTLWLEQSYTYGGAGQQISAPCTVILRREGDAWKCALMHAVAMPPG